MSVSLVARSRRVLTPQGLRPATLHVEDGAIASVGPYDHVHADGALLDFGEKVLLPGLFDSHVHVNDPGRAEWEGFETATAAAAAGGVTAIVDMPLNSVPTTVSAAALASKLAAARGRLSVDCGFWGGVVPGNVPELEPMAKAGVSGFKAFLVDSGIPEFPAVREEDLAAAMPVLAALGRPLIAHAEVACAAAEPQGDPRSYATYLKTRPKAWENEAIELLIRLCRKTRCRVHVVHLSSAEAVAALRAAKQEGLPVTAETCPHYLALSAEEVPAGSTQFKCCPPIREKANQERLWDALRERVIDFVVSDHSPCPPELKEPASGDFLKAWGGISSLELLLPVVWTEARRRGFALADVARWLCAGPAQLAGWQERKGALAPGRDADFVVFDPDASFVVEPARLKQRHKLTPYAGARLFGAVEKTYLRGEPIYDPNDPSPRRGRGRALLHDLLPVPR